MNRGTVTRACQTLADLTPTELEANSKHTSWKFVDLMLERAPRPPKQPSQWPTYPADHQTNPDHQTVRFVLTADVSNPIVAPPSD